MLTFLPFSHLLHCSEISSETFLFAMFPIIYIYTCIYIYYAIKVLQTKLVSDGSMCTSAHFKFSGSKSTATSKIPKLYFPQFLILPRKNIQTYQGPPESQEWARIHVPFWKATHFFPTHPRLVATRPERKNIEFRNMLH